MLRLWGPLAASCVLIAQLAAQGPSPATFRVLSWNVSGTSPVKHPDVFRGHLRLAAPDIVLLDEVEGSLSAHDIEVLFRQVQPAPADGWQLLWGARGGRQRIVIAAGAPLTPIDAFQTNSYRDDDVRAVLAAAPAGERARLREDMGSGVPVNAAVLTVDARRLMVVAFDLQCCASEWQQVRRLAEARSIRQLVEQAIASVKPDGLIIAGDFNLAEPTVARADGIGILPFVVLSGPYPAPIHGLIAAEALHRDGREAWTINAGAKSPFPPMPFDFQLYSSSGLRRMEAYVMDTADYPAADLRRAGLTARASRDFSMHRAVVATYSWTAGR